MEINSPEEIPTLKNPAVAQSFLAQRAESHVSNVFLCVCAAFIFAHICFCTLPVFCLHRQSELPH